ncbi:hypothetical protein [Bosea sp. (in: a-proteobacteria)]|uniref:hypothetical protein n=1 Tax=Bosea sp. (in: a-proteobacteria) TaxID=1871050 RepID=UPI001214E363|nr:hypothetical protein [Bosea sp. (in: a-proteobacteria)]TAJ30522.1 MAG: hypothetical protein EPO59_10710 [Bosea sp. (in: a-proteobacteria)]
MPFESLDDILKPDPRFADLCVVQGGIARRMTLADHHGAIADISLSDAVPGEVGAAFDRARNTIIYAFFDYDLFVVGEVQAFGAFELALKHRLNGHGGAARGTLRNLVDRARKAGILPALVPGPTVVSDPIEALIALRNGLSHGTSDIHSPGMALEVVAACASWIDHVFPS